MKQRPDPILRENEREAPQRDRPREHGNTGPFMSNSVPDDTLFTILYREREAIQDNLPPSFPEKRTEGQAEEQTNTQWTLLLLESVSQSVS